MIHSSEKTVENEEGNKKALYISKNMGDYLGIYMEKRRVTESLADHVPGLHVR